MGLYDNIDGILPEWMLSSAKIGMGYLMAGFAGMYDAFTELVYDGRAAAMPGQVIAAGVPGTGEFDNFDALPLIGRDRSIRQGLAETPWAYAQELRRWADSWTDAGTPFAILKQLAAVLGPDHGLIRLIYADPSGIFASWWSWDGTTLTLTRSAGDGFTFVPVPLPQNGVSFGGSVVATSSGTGGVIVLELGEPHFMTTGMAAVVGDVAGTTEANGTWSTVTVIDAFTISLDGSTFVNGWTGGGNVSSGASIAAPNTATAHGWTWDGTSNPVPYDVNDGSRYWIVLYAPLTTPSVPVAGPTYESRNDLTYNDPGEVNDDWLTPGLSNPPAIAAYVNVADATPRPYGIVPYPMAGTIGLNAPQAWVESIRHVVNDFQPADRCCAYTIVSFDASAFNPTTDSTPTSIPDGNWAWHGKVNGSGVRVPARFPNAEYIAAATGGIRR